MNRNDVVTFGCRLNAFESEVIRGHAERAGLSNTVIVNSCAVTAEAERQARQAIRKLRRARPEARIIVTGCAAQINPERFAAMDEVDQVMGNTEKLDPASYVNGSDVTGSHTNGNGRHARIMVNDIFSVTETAGHLIEGFEGRARAFVQVQQGCDHRCTFCVIPFGRGNSRSVPMGAITDQVRRIVANGCREVVLSGVDITSYGADLPGAPSLGAMARRLLANVPDLARLRLSSIDVAEIDDDLLGLIADEPRLMPHLHLSLQAGDDTILKRMKRRHDRDQAVAFCDLARRLRPSIQFGADLIAGFPTETEAMFEASRKLIAECGLIYLHVFPYSPRPETPAARMPQVEPRERKRRAKLLRDDGARALGRYLASRVGHEIQIVVEQPGRGRSEHYAPVEFAPVEFAPVEFAPVEFEGAAFEAGDVITVEITGVQDDVLVGRPVNRPVNRHGR